VNLVRQARDGSRRGCGTGLEREKGEGRPDHVLSANNFAEAISGQKLTSRQRGLSGDHIHFTLSAVVELAMLSLQD
jgi:hypothetical protein